MHNVGSHDVPWIIKLRGAELLYRTAICFDIFVTMQNV